MLFQISDACIRRSLYRFFFALVLLCDIDYEVLLTTIVDLGSILISIILIIFFHTVTSIFPCSGPYLQFIVSSLPCRSYIVEYVDLCMG